MVFRKPIVVVLTVLSLVFLSCDDKTKQPKNSTVTNKTIANSKDFHYLENDGIRMILPKNFERYSAARYESILDSLATGKAFEIEKKRLRHIRTIDGNNYIYFDPVSKSTITINAIPHKHILREDAKTLLSDMIRDQTDISKETDLEFTKITAKYNESVYFQVFKAIFKVTDKKKKKESFQHNYYISSKDKSLVISLSTALDIDFDTYLEKMIF
jgi:hypothetical protein